ncbi:MAG: hypothetical protein JWM78_3175 [Verrucomicrobiaceae bacterium]|nr:hypothetical protein [Verrucomicrobiaceae bacterium]
MRIKPESLDYKEKPWALWLTWEKQVRNRNLSLRLNAELVEIIEPGNRATRYVKSTVKSVALLRRWYKKTVFVQNPSIVLALIAVLLKRIIRYTVVVDAHNAGIYPNKAKFILAPLANFIIRFADFVIVTNDALADRVSSVGGRPLVLPDPLPKDFDDLDSSAAIEKSASKKPQVLFICTWAQDEPYYEVIAAAGTLPNVQFLITGSSKGREKGYGKPIPNNVTLTGYVPDADYHNLICTSDVIIDLTTREDCLVCGAYEAVAARKPFILSDSIALKKYFRAGGLHVANESKPIAKAVEIILKDHEKFKAEVTVFKEALEKEWSEKLTQILPLLHT